MEESWGSEISWVLYRYQLGTVQISVGYCTDISWVLYRYQLGTVQISVGLSIYPYIVKINIDIYKKWNKDSFVVYRTNGGAFWGDGSFL